MARWPILFLALSSLLLQSCAYHRYAKSAVTGQRVITTDNLKPVIPANGSAIKYKASIDILRNHFSGLIVLKQTDTATRHLVFVTELGMRMFDFEIKNDSIRPVFVFNPLNKPKLVSALVRDFGSMLLAEWYNRTAAVKSEKGSELLYVKNGKRSLFLATGADKEAVQQNVFSKRKKETRTIYTPGYTSIRLKQYGLVKLYIELEKIKE